MDWPDDNCYWMSGLGDIYAVSGHQGRVCGGDGLWVESERMYNNDIGGNDQRGHF